MGVPCRCWRCWARRTLPKHPDRYVRPPKCLQCRKRTMFVCKERRSRKDKRNQKCNCSIGVLGYPFTHRKGSKWCEHNPDINKLMQEFYEGEAA